MRAQQPRRRQKQPNQAASQSFSFYFSFFFFATGGSFNPVALVRAIGTPCVHTNGINSMPGLVAWDLTELLRYALTVSIGLSAASAAPPYASPVGLRPAALCPTW